MKDRHRTDFGYPSGLRGMLLIGCAGISLISLRAEAGGNLPSGGHFVAGTGGIATAGGATTVTQSSNRGIIDWRSFSIGKGKAVAFDNGSGATLNRVTGGSLSTIAGQLKATGSVYLINPNGVVVSAGGKVVTGGDFVASTRNVSDGQFMAGGTETFTGGSKGAVVNDGAVVSQNGSVVLIGHSVTNSGSIDAAKGTASLVSGNKVVMTEANGPEGIYVAKSKSAATTNEGQVHAAAVELAAAGGNVYALAGNRTGLIRATGTKTIDGQVWLTAPDGTVDVGGRVVARNADGTGGTIQAQGKSLTLENKAVLNAAGTKGRGSIETSGGKVAIGRARVTGGLKGKWVIDPNDLTIDSSAAATISGTLNGGTGVTEQTTATTASGSGTQGSGVGDINVNAAIAWSSTANLTLSAFHGITVNAPITISGGGDLFLTTNNNVGGASSGGTLSFVPGSGSARFTGGPGVGATLTIDGSAYTLIYDTGASATGLQSLNGSGGHFALAMPLDASGLGTLAGSLIPTFGGTFNGLGNTISNLTINAPAGFGVGLFGSVSAGTVTITDLGVINANVSGAEGISGLVGSVFGGSLILSRDYVSGTAHGIISAGGLVGENRGGTVSILQSFASASISGGQGGGLIGRTFAGSATNITQSYATGAIAAGTAGGISAQVDAGASLTLTEVYATGAVSGSAVGGLVTPSSGTITVTAGYWDTQTTGQGSSTGGGTGQTTAQLQAALPSGFDSSVWGIVPGKSYPYLKFEFPAGTTPQVVAGTVYSNSGSTNAGSGITVSGAVNGTGFNSAQTGGTVTTGANGYYYYLLAPGTIAANGNVIVSAQNFGSGGTATGAALASQSNGYSNTLDILANTLHVETPRALWSSAQTDLATAEGADASLTTLVNGLGNLRVDASSSFTVDSAMSYAGGTVTLIGSGAIGESGGAVITAGTLTGSSVGGATLTGANKVTALGPFSDTGAGNATGLSFTDAQALSTAGTVSSTGQISLVTTGGAGSTLTLGGNLTAAGDTVTLRSTGAISQTAGIITAHTLTGSSATGAALDDGNLVDIFGSWMDTDPASAGISLKNAQALATTGTIASLGPITLITIGGAASTLSLGGGLAASSHAVTLESTGTIMQTGGIINAATLTGSSVGGATLNGSNLVGSFENFADTGGGDIAFKNTATGARAGGITTSGNLTLTVAGVTIDGSLTAGASKTLTVTSSGAISQTGGIVTAGTLTGLAFGNVTLDKDNHVGTFSVQNDPSVNGSISFTDTVALTLPDEFSVNNLTITTKNGAGITVTGHVHADIGVTLNSAGTIVESGGGFIETGASLSGSSVGGADLSGSNLNASFENFTNTGGGITFKNTALNAFAGGITTAGNLTLTVSGITIDGSLTAGASKTLTINSSGTVGQTAGAITAGTLRGSSVGGMALTSATITDFGPWTDTGAGSSGINLTNSQALTVTGTLSSAGTLSTVTLTTNGGDLTVSGRIVAGDSVILNAAGALTSTGAGSITARSLSGSSGGDTSLLVTHVDELGDFTAGGNLAIHDLQSLTLDGNITASTAGFTVNGTIDQTSGKITATTLTGSSQGAATFDDANKIANLGPGFTTHGGDFSLVDARALTVANLQVTGGDVSIRTTFGGLTVGGITASGHTVTLTSAGAIAETGTLTAKVLTGSSVGGVTLDGANSVAQLGAFTNTGGGNFSFTDAAALETTGTILNSGNVTLTTTGSGHGMTLASQITGGRVTLDSAAAIDQSSGAIDPGSLLIDAAGTVSLTGANTVDMLAVRITGAGASLKFNDTANGLTIGTVGGVSGITTDNGNIVLQTTTSGDIALNQAIDAGTGTAKIAASGNLAIGAGGSVSAGGGAALATLRNFSNASGADAIAVGAGSHWLVYSSDPTADTDGGLKADFIQYAATYDIGTLTGTAPATAGDGFLYRLAPTLTLTGVTKTYDGTAGLSGASYSFSGEMTGDRIMLGGSPAGGYADKNAGTGIDVTVGGLTVTATHGGVAVFGYAVAPVTGGPIGTILKANLSVGLTGAVTKTYDGTTAATLGTGNFSLSGLVTGDQVTVSAGSAAYATSNAGTGILVTASSYTLSGADAGNYVLTATGGSADIGKIDPKAITAGLTGTVTKTYDGTTAATLTGGNYTLTGLVGGDAISVNAASGAYADENAGTGIAITATGLTLMGADAGNYVLAKTSATADIGKIDPKTITAGLTGTVTKTYDGTTVATLTGGNYTLTGLVGGDTVGLNDPSSGTYASVGPGSGIDVTVHGLTLEGADAGNYRLAKMTVTADIGVITPGTMPPPPPLPTTPFIPVVPPQPSQPAATPVDAHSLVVPKPEMADMAKLSGCSGEDFVAVVPGEDGHVGTVVVESEGNKTVLHAAYAGCSGSRPVITSPQEVNRLFGGALAARPTPPTAFQLYYRAGSVTLEPDAQAAFDKAFAAIGRRPVVDIVVTGFTDTVGTPQANDVLSLARAQAVAKLLLARGLKQDSIMTAGRGERDLQVKTAPQVAEDKNRRVEITVR